MNRGVVSTIKDKCKKCYSCVRNCPVKAVKVKNGQAEVLVDRCISCGNCVKVCSQNAKYIQRNVERVLDKLKKGVKMIVCLAPSFPAAFTDLTPGRLVGILKALGFWQVREVAFGAQLVAEEYKRLFKQKNKAPIMSSPCPAVVNLIEKHYPRLIPYLARIVSPIEALARYIKEVERIEAEIVFMGPCIAKKEEGNNSHYIDEVLTFEEVDELISDIKIKEIPSDVFDGPNPWPKARTFAISGGLLHTMELSENISRNDILVVEGKEDCIAVLESIENGEISPRFIDILFCKGCIDGPGLRKFNRFSSQEAVSRYVTQERHPYPDDSPNLISRRLDLSAEFFNKKHSLDEPEEEDIKKILEHTNKTKPEDELNCGACGYNSCREKAIAVYQGLAEIEMCLPYLLEKEVKEKNEIKELNEELNGIIESSYDGIWVSDAEGKTKRVNKAYADLLGVKRTEVVGKTCLQLEKEGIVSPSVTNLVIREKRRITIIQETKDGKKILATGTPIFDEDGELTMIMVNARDMSKLKELYRDMKEVEKLKDYFIKRKEREIDFKNIIAFSKEMDEVIDTATKVAKVNTTVLITGESGVGKDVIARFIHENSQRKKGPFVKINCGAIPETLLESELFGYESGAFTGAKRKGKPGLIEMADRGTLFLDEIGELPLNLQVKLLQVLQEHQLVRIGGVRPIKVDIRVIAATNRNLEKMIKKNKFRDDLYYRLNVVPIKIPPLRNRKDDVIPLIYHFLEAYNKKHRMNKEITQEAKESLLRYSWPGNVRELENLIERLIVTAEGDEITVADLPDYIKKENVVPKQVVVVFEMVPLKKAVEETEKQLLQKAIKTYKTTYDIAKALKVNQSTIVRKIKKYFKN